MSPRQPDKIVVYFAVFDFGDDPSVVTRELDIQPTESWVVGETIPGSKSRALNERWVLESNLGPNASIEDQLDDVIAMLESRAERLPTLTTKYRCAIRVAAYFHDTFNPSWEVSADAVHRLAVLNLMIDFDIYCLGD